MSGIMSMVLGARTAIAAAVDEFFNRVTLLLPGNGTNGAQNNTFLDSSSNNFTITRNGNTTQGTFSPFSQTGWSSFLPGTVTPTAPGATTPGGDYYYGSTNLWAATTSTFTVDGWIFPTSYSTNYGLILGDNSPDGATLYEAVRISSTGKIELAWYDGASRTCTGSTTVPLNQWSYFAVRVSSNAISIYVNSSTADTLSGTTTLTNRTGTTNFCIGVYAGNTNNSYKGYISNLRFSTIARTISVPTAPFTSDADTKLLTFQNNRVVDNSPSPLTISQVTSPSVQAFSPFAPTAAYSAATNGGSGYFDGTGDFLTVPNSATLSLGTGDFTLEGWFYAPTLPGSTTYRQIVDLRGGNFSNAGLNVDLYGSTLEFTIVSTSVGTATVTTNQWYYFALTRSGSTYHTYVNATRIATGSNSTSLSNFEGYIGSYNSGGTNVFLGYVSGVRLLKGTALYTAATITVPTTPPTAITNTQLLLNFTNAGITDATAKNDLETVGNAQISTTQSKFGGSSMYFDGTGDYVLTAPRASNILGNGDFTVEFWAYPSNTSSAYRALVSSENYAGAAGGWSIYQNGTSLEIWLTSGQIINATSALTSSTWQHVALSRASGTVRLFVNGTSVGSVSNSVEWTGQQIYVGDNNYSGIDYFYIGYIDDLRITKGYARYTANFTAPTAAFALQ